VENRAKKGVESEISAFFKSLMVEEERSIADSNSFWPSLVRAKTMIS
jgi:hypothetical protein